MDDRVSQWGYRLCSLSDSAQQRCQWGARGSGLLNILHRRTQTVEPAHALGILNSTPSPRKTSVSETIRKLPLAEAQTVSGKQKNTLCGTWVFVSLPKFCWKTACHAKFYWNRATGCWVMAKKRFSKRHMFAILNFNNHSKSCDCYRVPNVPLCRRNDIKIGWFFVEI